jgi:hypothetical protein
VNTQVAGDCNVIEPDLQADWRLRAQVPLVFSK